MAGSSPVAIAAPMAAPVSSTDPYAHTRASSLDTRSPSPSDVSPSSPARV